jgi:hypothetical protein
MGVKVDAVTKELGQLTEMVTKSCHNASKQWINFEQCNSKLYECNGDLMKRLNVLIQQGKRALDIYALADGDREAVWYLKMQADLRDKAIDALAEYKKEIVLLKSYSKRIAMLQGRIADLIGDRTIGLKSAKSLPVLQNCKKVFAKMAVDVTALVDVSENMPKLYFAP